MKRTIKTKAQKRIQRILSTSNFKIEKGLARGYRTAILHFSPHKKSGYLVCPKATDGCIEPCLDTSGLGQTPIVQKARIEKTRYYFELRETFLAQLQKEIESFSRSSSKKGLTSAFRLNGTSDLSALALNAAKANPNQQFYDYTKVLATLRKPDLPKNYDLTFSRSESNWTECKEALALGFRVAIVADERLTDLEIRKILNLKNDIPILNGDDDDLTFLKPKKCILRLTPKGKAKWNFSGFVLWHPQTIKEKIAKLKTKAMQKRLGPAKEFEAIRYLTLSQN